jgi:hypothetical protein
MTTNSRALVFCLLAILAGCSPISQRYRALPAPQRETPAANPPYAIRQTNWLSPQREGSCVHASLSTMLHWQNKFELAKQWRSQYSGGEYSDRLRDRLDAAKVPYAFTEKANLQLLDDAHAARRAALLWWKPSHCCNFVGWAEGKDGRTYAVILDNNRTQSYEIVERDQFHRQWASYGGFALMTLYDPPSPPVWKSFEPVEESWKW